MIVRLNHGFHNLGDTLLMIWLSKTIKKHTGAEVLVDPEHYRHPVKGVDQPYLLTSDLKSIYSMNGVRIYVEGDPYDVAISGAYRTHPQDFRFVYQKILDNFNRQFGAKITFDIGSCMGWMNADVVRSSGLVSRKNLPLKDGCVVMLPVSNPKHHRYIPPNVFQRAVDLVSEKYPIIAVGKETRHGLAKISKIHTNLVGTTNFQEVYDLISYYPIALGPTGNLAHFGLGFQKPTLMISGGYEPMVTNWHPGTTLVGYGSMVSCTCFRRECSNRPGCFEPYYDLKHLEEAVDLFLTKDRVRNDPYKRENHMFPKSL